MPRIAPARLVLLLAAVLAIGITQPLTSTATASTVPTPKTPSFQSGIDPYGSYVAQSTCNATAKPGVLKVKDLLNTTYGPRTIGIVRNCNSGGTSEHKEGRAMDWMISARVSSQKAIADSFIKYLQSTDSYGNTHAMARRMGVMYIIWNNKMWRAYDPGRGWAEYQGCSASNKSSTAYDTTCHRDHIHISFTWDGANAKTSFFTGKVPFKVSSGVSNTKPGLGSTVNVTGTVTPAAGSSGKFVSLRKMVNGAPQYITQTKVDSAGRYSFPVSVTEGGTHQFSVYKGPESAGGYSGGTSPVVSYTVGGVARASYALTIQATPDLVPLDTPILISGTAAPANVAAGKNLSLKRINPSTGANEYVKTVKVESDGTYATTITPPPGVSEYYTYIPSDTSGISATSPMATVDVRGTVAYEVNLKSSLNTTPVGGTVEFTGQVSPSYAAPGTNISLRKWVNGEYAYYSQTTVGATGGFRFPVKHSTLGDHTYRVFKPSDACDGGSCTFTSAVSGGVTVQVVPVQRFSSSATGHADVLTGSRSTFRAAFAPKAAAVGATVKLQRYENGVWRTKSTRTLNSNAAYAESVLFTSPGKYSYRYITLPTQCQSGVCAYTTSVSPTMTVKVADKLAFYVVANASASSVPLGKPVTISGRVNPATAAAGSTVSVKVLQPNGSAKWLASARVDATGKYSVSVPMKTAGKQVMWVYKPGAGIYGFDSSGRIRVQVG